MIDAKKPASYYMSALCVRPHARFDVQDPKETIILVLRAHPITLVPWILTTIGLIFLLIILNFFLPVFFTSSHRILLNIIGLVFIANYAWLNFVLYYYQVGIVTNKRVLDVDFYSILYRETSEARVYKIEDVTAKTGGYFGSVFNYGSIHVQTAGAEANIEFLRIPAPTAVSKIINDVHAQAVDMRRRN